MHDKNYVILNIVKRFFFYFFYFMIYQIYFIHFTTKIIREKERIQKLNLPAMGGCQRERILKILKFAYELKDGGSFPK